MRRRNLVAMLMGLSLLLVAQTGGETQEHGDRPLSVGTRQAPPFVLKTEDGTWSGTSIELWQAIATELQLTYEFRELDLQGLLDGIKDGSLDIAIGALTITAEREEMLDFTHPFHTTGLGIAVAKQGRWGGVVWLFVSWPSVQAIAALTLVLLVVSVLVWLFEHKRNPQHFGGRRRHLLGFLVVSGHDDHGGLWR